MHVRERFILNLAGPAFGAFFLGDVVSERNGTRALWWLFVPTSIATGVWAIESIDPSLYGPIVMLTAGALGLGLWLLSIAQGAARLARSGMSGTAAIGVGLLAVVLLLFLGLEAHALLVDSGANPYARPLRWGALFGVAAAACGLTALFFATRELPGGSRAPGALLSVLAPFVGLVGLRFFFEGRLRLGFAFMGGGILLASVVLSSLGYFFQGRDATGNFIDLDVTVGVTWFLDLVVWYIVLVALFLYAMLWVAQAADWVPQRQRSASMQEGPDEPGPTTNDEPTSTTARTTAGVPPVVYQERES